jgi:hypothetical protein
VKSEEDRPIKLSRRQQMAARAIARKRAAQAAAEKEREKLRSLTLPAEPQHKRESTRQIPEAARLPPIQDYSTDT